MHIYLFQNVFADRTKFVPRIHRTILKHAQKKSLPGCTKLYVYRRMSFSFTKQFTDFNLILIKMHLRLLGA